MENVKPLILLYIGSQQAMPGIKFGNCEGKGVTFYLSYYTGLNFLMLITEQKYRNSEPVSISISLKVMYKDLIIFKTCSSGCILTIITALNVLF